MTDSPIGEVLREPSHPVEDRPDLEPEVAPGVRPGKQREPTRQEQVLGHAVRLWQNRHKDALAEIRRLEDVRLGLLGFVHGVFDHDGQLAECEHEPCPQLREI